MFFLKAPSRQASIISSGVLDVFSPIPFHDLICNCHRTWCDGCNASSTLCYKALFYSLAMLIPVWQKNEACLKRVLGQKNSMVTMRPLKNLVITMSACKVFL